MGLLKDLYKAPKHIKLAGLFGPYTLLPGSALKVLKQKGHVFIRPHQFYPAKNTATAHLKIILDFSRFNGKCYENTGHDVNGNTVFFYSFEAKECQKVLPYCISL